mgnify:FL=1
MAKRKRRRSTRRKKKQEYPGWLWMLFGLSLGLSVAFAIYVKDHEPATTASQQAPQPASMQSALDDNDETAAAEQPAPEPEESRFTFYDMLPFL